MERKGNIIKSFISGWYQLHYKITRTSWRGVSRVNFVTDSFSKTKLKLIKLAAISRSPLLYKNHYLRVYSGVFNEGTHTKDLPSVFMTHSRRAERHNGLDEWQTLNTGVLLKDTYFPFRTLNACLVWVKELNSLFSCQSQSTTIYLNYTRQAGHLREHLL